MIRQANRIRRQQRQLERQALIIEDLRARLRSMHQDVELIGASIPREKRRDVLALVRDRHRVETCEPEDFEVDA